MRYTENPSFKKTIFISFLGHIAVFGIFSFSFGRIVPATKQAAVFFWGQSLPDSQVSQFAPVDTGLLRQLPYSVKPSEALFLNYPSGKLREQAEIMREFYFKPQCNIAFAQEKTIFVDKAPPNPALLGRRESAILFHPVLPYGFTLYFKDRQVAHVELSFKISSIDNRSSTAIKRRISSGNLEVDLLSKRYIEHYLYIQQGAFPPGVWQTVKIDLSAEND